jgi:hypothetical protein
MRWRLVLVDHLPGPGLPAVHLVELARCQTEHAPGELQAVNLVDKCRFGGREP